MPLARGSSALPSVLLLLSLLSSSVLVMIIMIMITSIIIIIIINYTEYIVHSLIAQASFTGMTKKCITKNTNKVIPIATRMDPMIG